jgi:hypothetical protein
MVSEVTAPETPKLVLLLFVFAVEGVTSICFWQEVKIKPITAANKILFILLYLYVKELIIPLLGNTNPLVFNDYFVILYAYFVIVV